MLPLAWGAGAILIGRRVCRCRQGKARLGSIRGGWKKLLICLRGVSHKHRPDDSALLGNTIKAEFETSVLLLSNRLRGAEITSRLALPPIRRGSRGWPLYSRNDPFQRRSSKAPLLCPAGGRRLALALKTSPTPPGSHWPSS